MSEAKRAKLISFGSQRVNNKNTKEYSKTVRISVILPESTEDKCPEFNYKDLFAATKRKDSVGKTAAPRQQLNGLDPFNEEDEDVKRIAAELEAKYGIGVAKKRKWRKDDFADIGMGYDESDSFIDNTDGYDEIIPKNVTTLHGGFYINCGALEFKTDEDNGSSEESSSSDEDTPDKPDKSVNHKRVLESSAESEEEAQTEKSDKVVQMDKKQKVDGSLNTNGMQKAIKKRLFSHDKIKQQMRKNRTAEDVAKKTVRELLRERREDLNMSVPAELDASEIVLTDHETSPKENNKKPLGSVDDVIESVISSSGKKKEDHTDESSKDSTNSKDALNNKSVVNSSEADSNDGVQMKPVEIVQLPENLPNDIIGIIESIKKAAACSTEGKVKFFSGNVNTMLLNLERKCRCLGKQSRVKVYEHLAPFVKCRKETLIKRAKNLCAVEEQKKIKTLLDRLKSTLAVIMPPLVEHHDAECRGVAQRKLYLQNEEAAKNLRMPKRYFPWSEDTKKLVKDIITLRKKCFINEGKQKESLEKHLTEFIRTEVLVLWPEGWMSLYGLLRCCNLSPEAKRAESPRKTPLSSSSALDISITPSSNSNPNPNPLPNITLSPNIAPPPNTNITSTSITPNISISATSSLTITPITSNVHKVSSSNVEVKVKPKILTFNNETIISKVNNSDSYNSLSKPTKTLPPVDIVKTSIPDVNNVKYNTSTSNSNIPVYIKDEDIKIEEHPVKDEVPENLSPRTNVIKHEVKDEPLGESNNHCQIIDLTDLPEMKKRPGPKSKTKYLYEYSDKLPKPKKEPSEHLRVKSNEELTGSSALNQIIADSLCDVNRFSLAQGPVVCKKSLNTTSINSSVSGGLNLSDSVVKKSCSSYDLMNKVKTNSAGDDILKVMEGLKVLQKMSSPVKSNEEGKTSSPVSVIAFNKSYSHDSNSAQSSQSVVGNRSSSFQDAFQKHFIPDYNLMRTSKAPSPPRGTHPSTTKHNHTSTKSSSASSDRYLQTSNNNYAQQSPNKLKTSCSSQQSGSYNMLDDMFANFLSEYGHPKTASSKSSTQHK